MDYDQLVAADGDAITVLELHQALDQFPVDARAVGASEILNGEHAAVEAELGMPAGELVVGKPDLAERSSPQPDVLGFLLGWNLELEAHLPANFDTEARVHRAFLPATRVDVISRCRMTRSAPRPADLS